VECFEREGSYLSCRWLQICPEEGSDADGSPLASSGYGLATRRPQRALGQQVLSGGVYARAFCVNASSALLFSGPSTVRDAGPGPLRLSVCGHAARPIVCVCLHQRRNLQTEHGSLFGCQGVRSTAVPAMLEGPYLFKHL
jgi:hypothetical protein